MGLKFCNRVTEKERVVETVVAKFGRVSDDWEMENRQELTLKI